MHRKSLFVSALATLLTATVARAEVPALVSFQGVLKSGTGIPLEGAQTVRFTLYNAPEGDQIVTDELQTFANGSITLSHSPVVAGTENMRKSDNTVTYVRGTAYTIDNATGIITSVAIPNGTSVKVSYRWTASSYWTETQTVQATHGLFAALLGANTSFPYSALTGSDWLGVEVSTGAVWQTLSPRMRLTSAPYSLRVSSVDGASGGSVNGGVTASATVTGTGRSYKILNFPTVNPGIQGNGVTGVGGDAPGVLAVGANNTGLALQAQGKIAATGDISGANLALTGNATVTGNLGVGGTMTTTGSITGGNLYSQGNVAAVGNVSVLGTISGIGAQRPDYDSGTQTMTVNTYGQPLILPASLGVDPYSLLVDFTVETQAPILGTTTMMTVYRPPSDSGITYYLWVNPLAPDTLNFWALRNDSSSVGKFHVRIWKIR